VRSGVIRHFPKPNAHARAPRAARRVLRPSVGIAPPAAETVGFDMGFTSLRHAKRVIQKVT
jgi:hypothetical protein